jgi:LmbE family N-acetylglucosaminyl deacetylase
VFAVGGALVDRRFGDTVVATVFTRSSYRVSGCGDVAEVSHERCREDLDILARLGAKAVHLGLDDASIRSVYADEIAYMAPGADPTKDPVWTDVLAALSDVFRGIAASRVLLPLAVGHHIDHVIARDAALVAAGGSRNIWYYQDATYCRPEPEIVALAHSLAARRNILLRPSRFSEKLRIASAYSSQVNEEILDAIEADLHCYGGERLWTGIGNSRYDERISGP